MPFSVSSQLNLVISFNLFYSFLAVCALAKKISIDEGWTWFPTEESVMKNRVYGTHRTPSYDFTIMKDTAEKGWVTKKEDA